MVNENLRVPKEDIGILLAEIEGDCVLEENLDTVSAGPRQENASMYSVVGEFRFPTREKPIKLNIAQFFESDDVYIANLVIGKKKDFTNRPEEAAIIQTVAQRVRELIYGYAKSD